MRASESASRQRGLSIGTAYVLQPTLRCAAANGEAGRDTRWHVIVVIVTGRQHVAVGGGSPQHLVLVEQWTAHRQAALVLGDSRVILHLDNISVLR